MPKAAPQTGGGGGGRWVTAHAACAGVANRAPGRGIQDAGACFSVLLPDGSPVLLAAVADGAGSVPLGGEGARAAVPAALKALAGVIRQHGPDASAVSDGMDGALKAARAAIITRAASARRDSGDYACTLIMAAGFGGSVVVGQIGDGGAVVWHEGGMPDLVLWPCKGEFANETAFVTDGSAAADLQVAAVTGATRGVALFTDGLEPVAIDYRRRAAHPGFFQPLFGQLHGAEPGDEGLLDGELGEWLAEERFDAMSPDDRTLILAVLKDRARAGHTMSGRMA